MRACARVIRAIASRLGEGDVVSLFPEGTTFPDDEVRPFLRGGFVAAPFSSGLMSRGRLNTQMWSSLSVTITGTPCMSHLFGKGLGQEGSTS